ncbi:MAG: GHKL domain-containing protein [Deltaproteobacteria bacterium]|nr:GHKL domain-containing protein [Deltaproteobacteria bacterium]
MDTPVRNDNDLLKKINWLMFFRVFFTVFLLGSTIFVHYRQQIVSPNPSLEFLYGIIVGVFILSIGYAVLLRYGMNLLGSAYLQIILDTVVVSLIIFATGCYSSIFSFLYILVIVNSSQLFFRKGSMFIAALSSIQYGLMVDLEYYGILKPFDNSRSLLTDDLTQVTYKIVITMVAFFAVAFLSSLLAEQARSSRKKLIAMEEHVRRVDRMAYMGEMAAGLAHEIRNPLASLAGSIQMLKEELQFHPGQEKLMRIILREADRLSILLSDFLLFARPPSGNVAEFLVEDVLVETLDLFEKDINCRRRVSITTDLIPRVRIAMDPVHFRQILWNLLLNAAEAIPDQGKIHIRMQNLQNEFVEIRIADTGHGILPEHIHSIFNPFFTTKPIGTGLGLSIVHRLLETYGGSLDVESQINEGTVVTLKIKNVK